MKLRLTAFLLVFVLMAIWEYFSAKRKLTQSKTNRWANNIALVVFNSLLLKLVIPFMALDMALIAEKQHIGLISMIDSIIDLSYPMKIFLGVVLLDLVIYWQHVLSHRIPLFWKLHKVHHSDPDIDVTTGSRFHPLEIIISMGVKVLAVWALGVPYYGVIAFEIVLNGMAMFNHSNINLPVTFDRILRKLIITPDIHRIHHSTNPSELNKNYGFNLCLWDRIFKTFQEQPKIDHLEMKIGLNEFENDPQISLFQLILMPFKSK
jgi:sterol desaturase/sphingolipid hydroxylase (fatty acid hydroxylase superfamily)